MNKLYDWMKYSGKEFKNAAHNRGLMLIDCDFVWLEIERFYWIKIIWNTIKANNMGMDDNFF